MKNIIAERAGEILICLIAFSITIGNFSLVTDDYAYFMSSLAAKQFSDFAYFDVHFQGFIGIREVYKLLYFLLPKINWHFVYGIVFEFLSLYLVIRAIKIAVGKSITNVVFVRVLQILFVLFFVENIVFVSHTRVSLIFCGIAMFNLAFLKHIQAKDIISNGLLFVFGMLLRPESSIGMFILVAVSYCVYSFDLKELIKRFCIPAFAILVFTAIFTIDWMYTDIFVRKVEPEIEYKMMAKRVVDIAEMKTSRDSVKYEAALNGMWFDVKETSPQFMRSMILPGADLGLKHAEAVFSHVCGFYFYYTFIPIAVAILFLLGILFLHDYWRIALKMLVLVICTFGIVYVLDYNGFLVSNRHFLSIQIVFLLIFVFYFFNAPEIKKVKHKNAILTVSFFILYVNAGFSVGKYKEENISVDNSVNQMSQTMKEFERKYVGRIVATSIDGRFLFDRHFYLTNEIYQRNTYLMFDWFTFPLTPRYVDYLNRTCKCDANNPATFFSWLADSKALYLATPHRFNLTQKYMHTVYGCDINFGMPVKLNSLIGIDNWDTKDCEIRTVSLVEK